MERKCVHIEILLNTSMASGGRGESTSAQNKSTSSQYWRGDRKFCYTYPPLILLKHYTFGGGGVIGNIYWFPPDLQSCRNTLEGGRSGNFVDRLPPVPGPLPTSKDNQIKPSLHHKSMAISSNSTHKSWCVSWLNAGQICEGVQHFHKQSLCTTHTHTHTCTCTCSGSHLCYTHS